MSSTRNFSKIVGSRIPSARRLVALIGPALTFALAACQPPVHVTRQTIAPEFTAVAVQSLQPGGARLRIGSYSVARFRASVAARQWPLMDSRTISHRYNFELASGNSEPRKVECLLITIVGDQARERTQLDCILEGEGEWRVRLAGRHEFAGALLGEDREYVLRATREGSADSRVSKPGYELLDVDARVATVPADTSDEAWFADDLATTDRDALAATVVAVLVGRELTGGNL
jgi:hypothetical protein